MAAAAGSPPPAAAQQRRSRCATASAPPPTKLLECRSTAWRVAALVVAPQRTHSYTAEQPSCAAITGLSAAESPLMLFYEPMCARE